MAQIELISFDDMEPADWALTQKFASVGSGIVRTTGRTGLGITGTTGATQAENTVRSAALNPGFPAVGYHGMAIKCSSLPATEQKLWALLADDSTVLATVTIRPNGTVRVYRGTFEGGTLLGTSATVFFATVFRYVEMGHILSGEGRFEVRSQPNTGGLARQLVVTGATSALGWRYVEWYLTDAIVIDDVYVNDIAGPPNYFSGNLTVQVLHPTAITFEGSWFDMFPWIPVGGTKVTTIDDVTMDGDATYNHVGIGLSEQRMTFEDITPDDERQIVEVKVTTVVRAVSSAITWSPQIRLKRFDGLLIAGPLPATNRTIYTALSNRWVSTGGLGGGGLPTIAEVNACEWAMVS